MNKKDEQALRKPTHQKKNDGYEIGEKETRHVPLSRGGGAARLRRVLAALRNVSAEDLRRGDILLSGG